MPLSAYLSTREASQLTGAGDGSESGIQRGVADSLDTQRGVADSLGTSQLL